MYERTEGRFQTPGGHVVTMAYRKDTNDYNTLNATLDGDEYRLPRGLSGTALDVGGYLGSVGIALALDNPELSVVIVEPVPDNADLIAENMARNGVSATLVRGAVGRGGETVEVWYGYRGSESLEHHAFVGNSSLAYEHGGDAPHETVTYRARALAEFLPIEFVPLDFLKVDCEGGEWAFLDTPDVRFVQTIVGEAHAVRGHRGSDIVGLLEATHDVTLSGDTEGTCEFRAVRR